MTTPTQQQAIQRMLEAMRSRDDLESARYFAVMTVIVPVAAGLQALFGWRGPLVICVHAGARCVWLARRSGR